MVTVYWSATEFVFHSSVQSVSAQFRIDWTSCLTLQKIEVDPAKSKNSLWFANKRNKIKISSFPTYRYRLICVHRADLFAFPLVVVAVQCSRSFKFQEFCRNTNNTREKKTSTLFIVFEMFSHQKSTTRTHTIYEIRKHFGNLNFIDCNIIQWFIASDGCQFALHASSFSSLERERKKTF